MGAGEEALDPALSFILHSDLYFPDKQAGGTLVPTALSSKKFKPIVTG